MLNYEKDNILRAKELRKNMTPWENKLWIQFLRGYRPRFQRQKAIDDYIVDFYCAKAKLVVELDGGGHYEPERAKDDERRSQVVALYGLRVLRFSNLDVERNFTSVCEAIHTAANGSLPQSLR